jgi:uncharacterized repeat protein (TIGR02543 family)
MKDTTLYAKWVDSSLLRTVTFDSDGGSAVPSERVVLGDLVPRPANPKKEGCKFAGWYREATLDTLWNFPSDVVADSITLYAGWFEKNAITYTVAFDSRDGTAVDSQLVVDRTPVKYPGTPTKQGHKFAGWYYYMDEREGELFNFAFYLISTDITLFAKWDVLPYKVTFEPRSGGAATDTLVTYGCTALPPATPTRERGYVFEGWYSDTVAFAPSSRWDFASSKVTQDTTLYARWSGSPTGSVTISFVVSGGDAMQVQVVKGDKIPKPDAPLRDGYTFERWYKDEAFEYAYNFNKDVATEDLTLYAKWIASNLRPDSVLVAAGDRKWVMALSDPTTFTYEMSCGDTSTTLRVILRLREGVESESGDTLTIAVPERAFKRSIPLTLFPTGDERKEEVYTLVLERRFEFSDIVHVQLGGRLLMAINNPDNSGYPRFQRAYWRRIKDGKDKEILGRKFYYVSPTSSSITDSMSVWLEDSSGTVLKSCPSAPPATSGASTAVHTSVYPNPVAAGAVVHLRVAAGHTAPLPDDHLTAQYDAYRLLDVQGTLQRAGSAAELQKGLRMPNLSGMYFLLLEGAAGKTVVQITCY